jgi:hypothetical protein
MGSTITFLLLANCAFGQGTRPAFTTQPVPSDNYWPNPEHLRVYVDRLTDAAARRRGFDENQRAAFRKKCEEACVTLLKGSRQLRMAAAAITSEPVVPQGTWPTPRMWNLILDRLVDDMAPGYGFDARQTELFRDWARRVALPRLETMRWTLEPAITDIMGQYTLREVPTTQAVTEWSIQLLPCYHELGATWDEGYRYMLPHLRPEQRAQWRRAYFIFKLGFDVGEAKLRSLAQGRFDPRELFKAWPGPHRAQEAIIAEAKQAGLVSGMPPKAEASAIGEVGREVAPSTAPAMPGARGQKIPAPSGDSGERFIPLDRWQTYTKQFIGRYRLDEGQKTSAMAILKEVRERADAYRKARQKDFSRLEKSLRTTQGDTRAAAQAELMELERPMQVLFEELRARLDQILTESQRQSGTSAR